MDGNGREPATVSQPTVRIEVREDYRQHKEYETLKSHLKHQERAEEISNYVSCCRGVASGRESSGG